MGMGKKLDALLGRSFKTSKFKATVALAVSRSAVLKNQRRARCSIARSDVVGLLRSGQHDSALLRVEQVIKEQNMLDVLVVLEGYCHLLVERINLMEQDKVCPEELKEAVSSLIFASTRCGEFPELQEIRAIFTSRFGKEFAIRAVELRNHCGVSPKIIQKLSARSPSLENKVKVIREIASDNNIDLPTETLSGTTMKNQDSGWDKQKPGPSSHLRVSSDPWKKKTIKPEEKEKDEDFTGSFKLRRRYTDVADAAQAAFESAAYAAAAARAAVELSRSESMDPDDPRSPNLQPRKISDTVHGSMKAHKENIHFEKIHPETSLKEEKGNEQFNSSDSETESERSHSGSSSDSLDGNVKGVVLSNKEGRLKQKDVISDGSDDEDEQKGWKPGNYNFDAGHKNDNRAQVGLKNKSGAGSSPSRFKAGKRDQSPEALNLNRSPMSVRTRRAYRR